MIVEAVKKTPPQRLFDHDELLSQPSTSGIEVKQEKEVPNEKRVTLAAAIENEGKIQTQDIILYYNCTFNLVFFLSLDCVAKKIPECSMGRMKIIY